MALKSFLIDVSRCTACRGCQIACKQWNKNPATETVQRGSHQNPEDLNWATYKLVRFTEQEKGGGLRWLFFADQCRHCLEPPCKMMADSYDPEAIIKDPETGAVLFTQKTKNTDTGLVRDACPYDIPREAPDGTLAKCTMCIDRVRNGRKPACVQVCPTGAMNFGDRDEMLALGRERLAGLQKTRPDAVLADVAEVQTIFLCEYNPYDYHDFAVAGLAPKGITRKKMLARLTRPFRVFA